MAAKVVEEAGGIDILVNNAGTNVRKQPEELSYEEWKLVLETNLDSAFLCSKACFPAMKRAGAGKILNNGSMLSIFGAPWGSPYASSKGGMVQLTKSLATAWAQYDIQVNCFLPGFIDTPLTRAARAQVEGLNEKMLGRCPAGRWGSPDDFQGPRGVPVEPGLRLHHRHGDPGRRRLLRQHAVGPAHGDPDHRGHRIHRRGGRAPSRLPGGDGPHCFRHRRLDPPPRRSRRQGEDGARRRRQLQPRPRRRPRQLSGGRLPPRGDAVPRLRGGPPLVDTGQRPGAPTTCSKPPACSGSGR